MSHGAKEEMVHDSEHLAPTLADTASLRTGTSGETRGPATKSSPAVPEVCVPVHGTFHKAPLFDW